MAKEITVINHKKEKIMPIMAELELTPIALHFKEGGSITDEPSIAIEMTNGLIGVIGQMSLKTLKEGLEELGYTILRDENATGYH